MVYINHLVYFIEITFSKFFFLFRWLNCFIGIFLEILEFQGTSLLLLENFPMRIIIILIIIIMDLKEFYDFLVWKSRCILILYLVGI